MVFLEGFAVGLALVVLIGPVLLVLVSTTVEKGKGSGLAVAFGIFVSDIVAVGLCSLGFARLFLNPEVTPWIGLCGGLLLIGIGLRYLYSPASRAKLKSRNTATSIFGFFTKGFLVNFVNPFVFVVWLGIIAGATSRHGVGRDLVLFLSGSVLGVFTLDVMKVFLANSIKHVLRQNFLKWTFRVSGVLLFIFGLRLMLIGFV